MWIPLREIPAQIPRNSTSVRFSMAWQRTLARQDLTPIHEAGLVSTGFARALARIDRCHHRPGASDGRTLHGGASTRSGWQSRPCTRVRRDGERNEERTSNVPICKTLVQNCKTMQQAEENRTRRSARSACAFRGIELGQAASERWLSG